MIGYDPYDDDAQLLAALTRADLAAQRRWYRGLTTSQRRHYAQANPEFRLRPGDVLPQVIILGPGPVSCLGPGPGAGPDSSPSGDPPSAGLPSPSVPPPSPASYLAGQARLHRDQIIRDRATPIGQRGLISAAYAACGSTLSLICAATAYVAAGPHAALAAMIPAGALTVLAILRRMLAAAP